MLKSKTTPLFIGIAALILIAVIALIVMMSRNTGFSGLERLPTAAYLERPEDFLGNRYLVEAQIVSQITWEEGVGRILAVSSANESGRLPIFIPASIEENLHVGQRYRMRVNIVRGGLIQVEALRKY